MESDMEDAAPVGTPQKQGKAMSREIADSDAEDDAMDIDDEKPRKHSSKVTPSVPDSTENSEGTVGSNTPLQVEEDILPSVVEPAAVPSGAREASIELEMDLDDKIVDTSLEQSETSIEHPHEVADTEPSAMQVGTTESLSLADDENRTIAADNLKTFEHIDETEPKTSPSKANRPEDLDEHTEESRPDEEPKPQAVEAESFYNATVLESYEAPIGSTQAEHIITEVLKNSNALEDVPSALATTQSEDTMVVDDTTISEVPKDDARSSQSPHLPPPENSTFDPLKSADNFVPTTLSEDRSDAQTAFQDHDKVEAIPAPSESFSDKSLDAPSSDAAEQTSQQVSNLEPSQVKQTPEQKRIVS